MNKEEYYDRNYSFDEIEIDPRFKRCEKEMKITFGVQILFTLISVFVAYTLGKGPVEEYKYIMGLPSWWFAVIVVTIVFTFIVIGITKMVFKDMDLTDEGVVEEKKKTAEA
ncbi:MAG: hypothetical protein HPY66_2422 [Firmicutes bacterium]|nr:hypothetical protein [Bacillota bacterium]